MASYMLGKKSDGHYNGIREFTDSIIENRPPLVTVGDAGNCPGDGDVDGKLNCRR